MFSEEDHRRQYAALEKVLPTLTRRRSWESVTSFLGEQTTQYLYDTLATTSGKRILDLGCGEGVAIAELAAQYPQHQFYGIDLFIDSSSPFPASSSPLSSSPSNLHLLRGDVQQLPFPQKSFDLLYSTLVFSYVSDKLRGLREAHRVLNRQGNGFIYIPPSVVSFVDRELDDLLPREKDIEWRADGRLYLHSRHSRRLFKPWEYLCMVRGEASNGLVQSIYYKP